MSRSGRLFFLIVMVGINALCSLHAFANETATDKKPAAATTLSFRNAYERVLAYYPRLKYQHAKVEEAVAEKFRAYGALLPTARGSASVMMGDDPVYVFGSLLRQTRFASDNFALSSLNSPRPMTNFNFTLHGEIPLFNAFQTFSRIRSSKFLLDSEKNQEVFTKMEASLLVFESYLKGILTKENTRWSVEAAESGLQDLGQAEELKNKGMVLGADFYAAKMIHGEIKQLDYQTTADQKNAGVLLNILMGEKIEAVYELPGKIPGKVAHVRPLQEWLEGTYQSRPDLLAFRAKVESQRSEMFREKMSALPQVKVFADLSEDSGGLTSGGENYVMGFEGRMDLLDADYWTRRKKAKEAYEAICSGFQQFRDQISKDVSQAFHALEAVQANLPIAEEVFQDAGEAAKQTEALYREGRKSIAELLEIRRAFLYAAFKRSELLFQSQMAYANLLFLSGRLDQAAMEEIIRQMDGAS